MPLECITHYQWNPFIGLGIHDSLPPMPPVPCILPHISFSVINGLWLGSLPTHDIFGGSAFGGGSGGDMQSTFGCGGIPFMGRTNDAGFIVPHVSIPPANTLLPFTILFGSSLSVFGSSSVKVKTHNLLFGVSDSDLSCCIFPHPIPLSLNLACNDPLPFPSDLVFTWGNVTVGVTWADVLAALIDVAVEVGMAWLGGKIGGSGSATDSQKAMQKTMKESGPEMSAFKKVPFVGDSLAQAFSNAAVLGKKGGREAVEKAGREAAAEVAEKAAKEAGEKAAKESTEQLRKNADKLGDAAGDATRKSDEAADIARKQADQADAAARKAADADQAADAAKRQASSADATANSARKQAGEADDAAAAARKEADQAGEAADQAQRQADDASEAATDANKQVDKAQHRVDAKKEKLTNAEQASGLDGTSKEALADNLDQAKREFSNAADNLDNAKINLKQANEAADSAAAQADQANRAATAANKQADQADAAADAAKAQARQADEAAAAARKQADDADQAAKKARQQADDAATARNQADAAARTAKEQTDQANQAAREARQQVAAADGADMPPSVRDAVAKAQREAREKAEEQAMRLGTARLLAEEILESRVVGLGWNSAKGVWSFNVGSAVTGAVTDGARDLNLRVNQGVNELLQQIHPEMNVDLMLFPKVTLRTDAANMTTEPFIGVEVEFSRDVTGFYVEGADQSGDIDVENGRVEDISKISDRAFTFKLFPTIWTGDSCRVVAKIKEGVARDHALGLPNLESNVLTHDFVRDREHTARFRSDSWFPELVRWLETTSLNSTRNWSATLTGPGGREAHTISSKHRTESEESGPPQLDAFDSAILAEGLAIMGEPPARKTIETTG